MIPFVDLARRHAALTGKFEDDRGEIAPLPEMRLV